MATTNARADPMAPAWFFFMAVWVALALGSWLWMRSRSTAAEKRLWHRRLTITAGVIFGGFMMATMVSWHQYFGLLFALPAVVLISYLNLNNTFFCDACGKMTQRTDWWSREPAHFCPKCGHKYDA